MYSTQLLITYSILKLSFVGKYRQAWGLKILLPREGKMFLSQQITIWNIQKKVMWCIVPDIQWWVKMNFSFRNIFSLKTKKANCKFVSNSHIHIVQPFVFKTLMHSYEESKAGVTFPSVYKNISLSFATEISFKFQNNKLKAILIMYYVNRVSHNSHPGLEDLLKKICTSSTATRLILLEKKHYRFDFANV